MIDFRSYRDMMGGNHSRSSIRGTGLSTSHPLNSFSCRDIVTMTGRRPYLSLPAQAVHLRTNGIEFLHHRELPVWNELTVEILSPVKSDTARCQGLVIGCCGNRHNGYVISIVFSDRATGLESRIRQMVGDRALA